MINPAPLQSRITIAAARQLTELDPTLDRIITLAEHNDFLGAADQAQKLWQQQIYDVRTLGFYLFGVFMEQGLAAVPLIIACIETTVTTNWPHLGPMHGLPRHLDGALRWLFINIVNQLRFHQRKKDEQWKLWLKDWEQAPQPQILQHTFALATSLEAVVAEPLCCSHLFSLGAFLRGLPAPAAEQRSLDPGTKALPAAGAADLANTEYLKMEQHERGDAGASGIAAAVSGAAASTASGAGAVPSITLPLSPPLQLLIRKLAAFNQLVKLGKFRQAVIVYRDVSQSLAKFDPRSYLPSLLGEYFCNIVAHSQSLTQNLGGGDDFTAQALEELYRLDLDLFVAAKG